MTDHNKILLARLRAYKGDDSMLAEELLILAGWDENCADEQASTWESPLRSIDGAIQFARELLPNHKIKIALLPELLGGYVLIEGSDSRMARKRLFIQDNMCSTICCIALEAKLGWGGAP